MTLIGYGPNTSMMLDKTVNGSCWRVECRVQRPGIVSIKFGSICPIFLVAVVFSIQWRAWWRGCAEAAKTTSFQTGGHYEKSKRTPISENSARSVRKVLRSNALTS